MNNSPPASRRSRSNVRLAFRRYQLAVINTGIINDKCTNLVPNETICLGYQGEDCTTVYSALLHCPLLGLLAHLFLVAVKKSDVCDAISAAYNVNNTLLHENNPQINPDCSNIYPGEVLCVASTVIVPPPAGGNPSPASTPPAPASPPASSPPAGNDNDDDDDLPYCDEL